MNATIAERFKRDTAKHELTVLHDDGLYRHLRLMEPRSSHHWFEIVTWPQSLTIRGDMGSYTFSRAQDMFDFFRRSAWAGEPNLQYWEEKLDSTDIHSGAREYSEELIRQHIETDVQAWADDDLTERLLRKAEELDIPAGRTDLLPSGVAAECRAEHETYMEGLREELDSELLGDYSTWALGDEGEALSGVRQFSYRPDDAPRDEQPFTFDPTEWDVRDWSHHYLWCCRAILHGIAQYDRELLARERRASVRRIRDARRKAFTMAGAA